VARLLRNGTTTALYFASLHLAPSLTLARICAHAGQRAFVGKVGAPLQMHAREAASLALGCMIFATAWLALDVLPMVFMPGGLCVCSAAAN